MSNIQVKIKGNKTLTPLVAAFFTHSSPWTIKLCPISKTSKTNPLKQSKAYTNHPSQIDPQTAVVPFKSSTTIPIIYKTYSPMRIINPQPIKISKSIPKPSHKPKLRDLRSLNSKSSVHFVVCHPLLLTFLSVQNQLVLRGWISPWGLMGAQT